LTAVKEVPAIYVFFLTQWDYFTRMKQAILFASLIAVCHNGFSGSTRADNPINRFEKSFTDTVSVNTASIHDMLAEIMSVTGLQSNFELRPAKVRNIQASISHKKRLILYNPSFIDWIGKATDDKWGVIALLAHEVGHHLNGHTIKKSGSNPEVELEADEFAGFILNKLGASLKDAQEVMIYIASKQESSTHPGRTSRMEAIEKGWTKAGNAPGK
jgi:hypothetical protein